jgi:broad specificity phosphatase PhoE
MSTTVNNIYLVRHGQTAWSITGQHTGLTDLPLTSQGEEQARALAPRLKAGSFDHVLSSPLRRARQTCELAGFAGQAALDPDLVEWDYGDYEGRTLAQIQEVRPDWELFRDGCPGGESVAQITERVDRVVSRLRKLEGSVLIFSSGHVLRVLAARWVDSSADLGRRLMLDPACICELGYDHGRDRVIRLWNQR